ncbi:hypothetical protein L6452_32866 [Arctium lappa]|uniref:Uncharacterized protein n=1 Tax=Arctium lappa TaxID=4217 RepID=A0ACB8Z668_ARCLA|nr:hypothetical protein L6452_32866 [Arctium lappa]
MSVNNNNSQKNPSVSTTFWLPFASQFQLSQYAAHAHAQAITQAQSNAQAQAMANQVQFQAQLQAQGLSLNQSHGPYSANAPSFPGSANSSTKRMPQKPLGRPPGMSNANTISPMRMMELTPAERNKKKCFYT